jgi:hypothetical protein
MLSDGDSGEIVDFGEIGQFSGGNEGSSSMSCGDA